MTQRVANIPQTSVSLLSAISRNADSVRWVEFVRTYESPMRGFLHQRFPDVDPDDAMQDTLLALTRALPRYQYTPDTNRHFRNYLMGILAHKAADLRERNRCQSRLRERLASEQATGLTRSRATDADSVRNTGPVPLPEGVPSETDGTWHTDVMEAAVEQLLADPRIRPSTREVFRHVALLHEPPDHVAATFGITRNNVDQIKKRLIDRLATLVRAMSAEAR